MNFASDNHAGAHPKILQAIIEANSGHVHAYGEDVYTARTLARFKEIFGQDAESFFVFNGTAANVLSLKAAVQSHQSVLCAESAHIHVDECGAPEKFIGCKLIPISTANGKLSPELLLAHFKGIGDQHHSQIKAISITQSTEYGTVYTISEIREIALFARSHGLILHMDGARLSNACATLGCSPKEMSVDSEVDILSFGGTKNGLLYGEAIVIFNPKLVQDFQYIRKQGMQLASKMRFISIQFEALLTDDLWLENARQANEMASLLYQEIQKIPEISVIQKPEANAVFALVPKHAVPKIQSKYFFYVWKPEADSQGRVEVRWMTSFNTTSSQVMDFVKTVKGSL